MVKYYYIIHPDGPVLSRDKNILKKEYERALVLHFPIPITEESEKYRFMIQLDNLLQKERYAPSIDVCINGKYKTVRIEHLS